MADINVNDTITISESIDFVGVSPNDSITISENLTVRLIKSGVQIYIGGVLYSNSIIPRSLLVENIITRQVDRCKFSLRKYGDNHTFTPTVGKEVTVYNDGTVIFGGIIVKATQRAESYKLIVFDVECEDFTRLLDRKLVVNSYTDTSISDIIDDINNTYLTGFTTNNVVGASKVVAYIAFNYTPVSEAFRQLADLINFDWYVDFDKDIHFFAKNQTDASIDIEDDTGTYIFESLRIRRDNSQVKNVIYVRGGEYLANTMTSDFISDATQNIYTLPYRFEDITVTVTGQVYDGGTDEINDIDNYDYLWNNDEKFIHFRGNKIPSSTTPFTIKGKPFLPVRVKVKDETSIASMVSSEGGDGEYEYLVIDNAINSREGARERASGELEAYKNTLSEGSFRTYTDGLVAGQRIRINSIAHGIDEYFIINKVTARMWTHEALQYDISLVTTRTFGIIEFLQKILNAEQNKIIINPNEILDVVDAKNETVTIEESNVVSLEHNPQSESFSIGETVTAQSLNYDPDFVLGDFLPIETGVGTDINLIGRWLLDDDSASTVVSEDVAGNDATCSVNTNTLIAEVNAYPGGRALSFAGAERIIYRDFGGANYDLGNNDDYSIACWIKSGTQADQSISEHWEDVTNSYPWSLRGPSSGIAGKVQFSIYDGANNPGVSSDIALDDDEWHHVVGVRDNTNNKILFYTDARMTEEKTDTTGGDVSSTVTGFTIASRAILSDKFFTGQIRDFRIYDKALTQLEITELYHTKKRTFLVEGSILE